MIAVKPLAIPHLDQPQRSPVTAPAPASAASIYLPPFLVGLLATVLACHLYGDYLTEADGLWYSTLHDRHAHLWLGMSLAVDFRTLDAGHFLKDLHGARIWGPLHPLIVGLVLAVGGLDEHLAVLPSLACWVGCAVFAFLAARGAVPQGGNLAGTIAALFVLASPAYRAFATDIMLESMGACLSLGAVYFYLRTCQDRTAGAAAGLGLMLSLLFFVKYNYYLLVVLALGASTLAQRPFEILGHLLVAMRSGWRPRKYPVTKDQTAESAACGLACGLRGARPLETHTLSRKRRIQQFGLWSLRISSWVLGALILALVVTLCCPGDFQLGRLRISTRSPHNLVSVIVIVLFLRLLPWWWREGRQWVARLGVPGRQLVCWHAWPVVLWFLWPQRLGNCFAYLTRLKGGGEATRSAILGGLPYYWHCLGDHYHAATWLAYLVVALAAVALVRLKELRPGAAVVFWFLLLAGTLTVVHPAQRSRFMHSWLATVWVAAGVGAALLLWPRVSDFGFRISGFGFRISKRYGLAVAVVALLTWSQVRGLTQAGRAPEGGPRPHEAVALDLVNPYLPHLDTARRPVILSNTPLKFLAAWTYLKRNGRHGGLETDIRGCQPSGDQNQAAFQDWLKTTTCDTLLWIQVAPGTRFDECRQFTAYDALPAFLAEQNVFKLAEHWDYPRRDEARISLWKRAQ